MSNGHRWPPGIKVEAAFTYRGFSSWQGATAKFCSHEMSEAHNLATMSWMRRAQPTAATLLDRHLAANQIDRTASLMDQLRSLRYLSRQGLAIRGPTEHEGNWNQLIKLLSHDSSRLQKWMESGRYMSHDIINEQLHLMSMEVIRSLVADIRQARCFSVIADETRDISGREQFSISVRWIDTDSDFQVCEDFIGVVDGDKTDSATLTAVIMDVLLRCNLDPKLMVGQAYDGASNMSGRLNGVAARILTKYPAAMFIHCSNHCLQLCVEDAGSESICVQEAPNLCTCIYNIIKLSPKRLAAYEKIQQLHQQSHSSIKPLCPTRWTVRAVAISSVLSNYDALQETLDAVVKENGRGEIAVKASGVLAQMVKFQTVFGLPAAKVVFTATDQAATTLQGKDMTAADATGIMISLKKYLNSMRDSFDAFWSDIVKYAKHMDIDVTVPRQRKLSRRRDDTGTQHTFSVDVPQEYYKQQYFAVIDAILGQLRSRFSQSSMDRLGFIETVLLDAANGRVLNSTVAPEHPLSVHEHFIDYEKLTQQQQMLSSVLETMNEMKSGEYREGAYIPVKQVTSVRSLANVMNSCEFAKTLCSEVFKLCIIYMTVPMTSATAEHSFSAMRRLKSYLHQTMTQQRLNDVMLLHIHKGRTDCVDIKSVARSFATANDERICFFGNQSM